jgi:tetratricopeptide (TPR) repeat protein
LEHIAQGSSKAAREAAFELFVCLEFAFGTARNEKDSLEWLRKSGVDIEYVERKLEYVASRGSYYGPFQHDDLSEYLEYDTGWEYATTGLLDEAIAALQTEIQGKVEHTVIHSRLHLQSVLAHLLSYRGGVEDRERSLKLRIDIAQDTEQELGEEHADSLRAKAFLAVSLRNRQRAEEAEPIQRRVLEIRRKTRKSDHPDILQSMGDLAYTLSLIYPENLEESIELLQQVYESHVNIFGHSNRKTIDSLSQLIKVLDKAGKKAMTENMCRRNLDVCIPSLPARHPSIVETQITLARTLLDSGRDDEAVALAEDWIKGSAEELARIDGGIIDLVRSTLVKSVSKNQGHRWVDLAERLSSLSEMRYGSKSRDAIRDKARVGLLLYQSNRFRESQTVWKEVAHVWGNATPKNELEEINAVAFWGLSLLYNDQLEEATNVMLQLGHLSKGKDDKTVKSTVRELRRVEKACRAAGLEEQARSLAQFSDQELSTVT